MDTHGLIGQGFVAALMLCMALVVVGDARRYIIPNWLNLAIVGLFILAWPLLGIAPWSGLAAASLVLLVGFGIFALGLMGGGDVKLLAACTLWTGWTMRTPEFLLLTAMVGGVLVVVVLLMRLLLAPLWLRYAATLPLPRLLTRKEPVPYGIAIAIAFTLQLLQAMQR